MKILRIVLICAGSIWLQACASVLPVSDKQRCEVLLDETWQQLTSARLTGVSSAWQLTKASKFLAQARVKYEMERYELCIDKAGEAQTLLSQLEN